MALYSIGKNAGKEYFVDLSDDEVEILIKLIKENKPGGLKNLYLQPRYPEIFKKIDRAYFKKECSAKKVMRILNRYRDDDSEYDIRELAGYCELHYGYSGFDPEEYFDTDDIEDYWEHRELYQEEIDEEEHDIFKRWYNNFLSTLSQDEALDFYYGLVHEDYLESEISYTASIPLAIIKKARVTPNPDTIKPNSYER